MMMDDLDRALSSEEPLVPSSGFASGVMDAVRESTIARPSMPFPWGRCLLGVAACGAWAMAAVNLTTSVDAEAFASLSGLAPQLALAAAAVVVGLFPLYRRRLVGRT